MPRPLRDYHGVGKALRRSALSATIAFAGICSVVTVACLETDDTIPTATCPPGETRPCDHASGCHAEQICLDESKHWSACTCVTGQELDAGEDIATTPDIRLGNNCANNEDCPPEAFCLLPDATELFGGAPSSAVCVADCTSGASACDAFASAVCVPVSRNDVQADAGGEPRTAALCFDRCTVGSDDLKCNGNSKIACEPLSDAGTDGFCRPLCTTDADCAGRACDPRFGVCVESVTAPINDIGTVCDPTAVDPACAGVCTELSDTYAVCSTRCIFGESGNCAPDSTTMPNGGCILVTPGGTIGDLGFCAELCDCPADCQDPNAVCDPFADANLTEVFGRAGVCTSTDLALSEPLVCQ